MKFFIVGMHSSYKHTIAKELERLGMKYGKLFSTLESEKIYGDFELFKNQDITEIFENDAYTFLHEMIYENKNTVYKYYEGLSDHTLDYNDVFVLSPDQFLCIPNSKLPQQDVLYIWLDNTKIHRKNVYMTENRVYGWGEREEVENQDLEEFIKNIYEIADGNILYFTNEEPERVATIIYTLYKYPELLELYKKSFK